jgi:hypothetical protein
MCAAHLPSQEPGDIEEWQRDAERQQLDKQREEEQARLQQMSAEVRPSFTGCTRPLVQGLCMLTCFPLLRPSKPLHVSCMLTHFDTFTGRHDSPGACVPCVSMVVCQLMLTVCAAAAARLPQELSAHLNADVNPLVVRAVKAGHAAAATRPEVGIWKVLDSTGHCIVVFTAVCT